ncbi:MAG TPA: DUF3795 domain-containing protein [Patescibacteria group bacterium]|nr:DUF3795 domain-containing protein [Patescibacteria group bacterium]
MGDESLISRCGLYCGACYVYRAERDGGELLREIAEQNEVLPEEVKCKGCTGPEEDLWRNCRKCNTLTCLKEKGYEFCHECKEFDDESCELYARMTRFSGERGEDIRASMERIRAGEAEAWLREQDAAWRCPNCNDPTSWYDKTCRHCGKPL